MDARFKAMGTACHLQVEGGPLWALEAAEARIAELENRWSRFRPDSEVSKLNRALGQPMIVSNDTVRLIEIACTAWRATSGLFDPTVFDSLIVLGYDRSYGDDGFGDLRGVPYQSPGCEGIEIDRDSRKIRLPLGVRIDPGGIGKGLAADIVAEELQAAGAESVLVNLGGDIRVAGAASVIAIDEPLARSSSHEVALQNAGLATTTTLRRRWMTTDGPTHHVIDPSTGYSAVTQWVVATAIAGTAWWAEAVAKALLIGGPDAAGGAPWRLVTEDRIVSTGGGFDAFIARRGCS